VDEVTGLIKHNVEEPHEDDIEDQVDLSSDEEVHRELDEDEDGCIGEEEEEEVSYVEGVTAFMQLLLHNPLGNFRNLKNNPEPCPLCQEDETLGDEHKVSTITLSYGTRNHYSLIK
jgi:hypothetical protein